MYELVMTRVNRLQNRSSLLDENQKFYKNILEV